MFLSSGVGSQTHLGQFMPVIRPRVSHFCVLLRNEAGGASLWRSSRSLPRTDGGRFCDRCCREYCHANRYDYYYAKFYASLLMCDMNLRCDMKTILLCSTCRSDLPQKAYNASLHCGCYKNCHISCSTCRVLRYSSTYQIRSTSNYLIIRYIDL